MTHIAALGLILLLIPLVGLGRWVRARTRRENDGMPVLVFRERKRSRKGRRPPAFRSGDPDGFLDATLQLLPGRLKVCSGPDAGGEIQFVRIPGSAPEVTFGRAEGPRHRHVQLHSLVVSRIQARLRFQDGVWTLRNESRTNPTALNGTPLTLEVEDVELRHGDRIQMGDRAFVLQHEQTRERAGASVVSQGA